MSMCDALKIQHCLKYQDHIWSVRRNDSLTPTSSYTSLTPTSSYTYKWTF